MTARKFFPLVLLPTLLWLQPARATQTTRNPAASGGQTSRAESTKEDELARHLSAAETFQLSGDLKRAAVENRAVVAVALARLAVVAIREGQFARAVELLGSSLSARDDADARTNLAIAQMRLLQIDKATAEARAALALDARNARAQHVLGKLLYMKGDHAGALTPLERAVALEPDLDAAYTLGMTYLRLKQLERARLLFEEMQTALKNSGGAHTLFGRAYEETGYHTEAEREFRRALAVDPKTPRAHFYLAYVILLHGGSERIPEAVAEFERELQQHPQDFYSNFFLGMIASTVEGNHAKALRHLTEATRVNPRMGEAFLYLGQSQAELGDAEAERSLRRAIELTPDAAHNSFQIKKAHFLLGRVLLKAGRRAEGQKELEIAKDLQGRSLENSRQELSAILGEVASPASGAASSPSQVAKAAAMAKEQTTGEQKPAGPDGAEVLLIEETALDAMEAARYKNVKSRLGEVLAQALHNLGVIAAQEGELASSIEQFAAAALWKPDFKGLDRNWGIVSFRAAQYDKAVAPLSRHLQLHPEDALARRMLAVSFYLTRDFPRVVQTLAPLEPSLTNDPELAYTYGVSLVHVAEHKRAAQVFARLAESSPRNAPSRFLAAQGFMLVEDFERALRELRTVAELDARMPQVHYHAGQSLIRLSRMDEAEREFRQELTLNPSDERAKYHLAYVLLEQKRQTSEAVALLRETVARRPDYADARYQLGKALVEQGDARGAVEHLEAAARIEPARDYIQYQLSIAYRRAERTADAERALRLYRELKASNRSREQQPSGMGAKQNVP
jgi:tetratricopeptide (TPR) repeat protein